MVKAIIAALFALVFTAAAVVAVLITVGKRRSSTVSVKKAIDAIGSVGVKSTLRDTFKNGLRVNASDSSGNAASAPSDILKSRFMAFAILSTAIFGTLTAKLWTMQVLAGQGYRQDAEENKFTTVSTQAPRGFISDYDGTRIVSNRSVRTVVADPDVSDDPDVMMRLSAVLGVPYNVVRARIKDSSSGAQSQRVVASDVRMRDVAFISEHADAFKGVEIQTRTVRDYPYGALAAHALGYTGTISSEELEEVPEGRDLELGDDVGKSGVEAFYDNLLAGDHGERKVIADSQGNIVELVSETQPTRGSDIRLTLRAPAQYVADKALAHLIAPNGIIGEGTGVAGAVVAIDLTDGGVACMASFPTYDPAKFIGGIPQETWDLYNTKGSRYPLMNRTIAGSYPAASTYKPFTGLAALQYGFATTTTEWTCTGSWDGWDTGEPQACWEESGHGKLNFKGGIVNSCDVVFYDIAQQFFDNRKEVGETALQDYLTKFRFDKRTGIDLSGESVGRIPTPTWKAEHFRDAPEEAEWVGGDMTNMIIGQGYVLVTPIEMAVAYGSLATGKVLKPHLLKEVCNAAGDVVVTQEGEVVEELDVESTRLTIIRDALRGVATENENLAKLFSAYGVKGACKTGTAEVAGEEDSAWFCCYAPYDDPKYAVAVIIEQGGGGGDVAGPVGIEVMSALLNCDAGNLNELGAIAGSSGKSVDYNGSSGARLD